MSTCRLLKLGLKLLVEKEVDERKICKGRCYGQRPGDAEYYCVKLLVICFQIA